MFTDNIVLYAAFYGNLQFVIIGLAYSAEKRARLEHVWYEADEFYGRRFGRTSRSPAYREEQEVQPGERPKEEEHSDLGEGTGS